MHRSASRLGLIAKLLVFRETNYYGDALLSPRCVYIHASTRVYAAVVQFVRCNDAFSIMQKLCAPPELLRVVTFGAIGTSFCQANSLTNFPSFRDIIIVLERYMVLFLSILALNYS